MTKMDTWNAIENVIAIPVTRQGWDELSLLDVKKEPDTSWKLLVLGQGQEEMPFSTAKYAAKGKQR